MLYEVITRVHNRLFELIDLSRLGKVSEERVRQDIRNVTLEDQREIATAQAAAFSYNFV